MVSRKRVALAGLVLLALVLGGCRPAAPPEATPPPRPVAPPVVWGLLISSPEGLTWVAPDASGQRKVLEPLADEAQAPFTAETVEISPDGTQVALATSTGALVVLSLTDGRRHEISSVVGDVPDARGAMAWSADSRKLAFIEQGNLLVWEPEAEVRTVISTRQVTDMAWSPDGAQLVYGEREASQEDLGLWLVSAAGGEAKLLAPATDDIFAAAWPSFSPDGKWIAFWHAWEGGGLAFVRPDGSEYRQNVDFGGPPEVWRADGSAVIYLSLQDEMTTRGVYQCTPVGKPEPLVKGDVDQVTVLPSGALAWLRSAGKQGDITTETAICYRAPEASPDDDPWEMVVKGSYGECRLRPDGAMLAVWIGQDDGQGGLYVGTPGEKLEPLAGETLGLIGWARMAATAP